MADMSADKRTMTPEQWAAECPDIDEARALAKAWADGAEPTTRLLRWVSVFMLERWGGEAIGSATVTGLQMAWHIGLELRILDAVRPVGSGGVVPLCELAGWPEHPEPGDEPLPPIR